MKVTMENLGKKYEGRENFTLRNINLEIEDQEFLVILGPSGCGKSTLLRMIAGLNSITEGELYFGGKLMNKVQPKDRDIAMVFQSYALYPHLTVYDNMAFSLKMQKERKEVIHQKVMEAAEVLQLEDYLYSKPSDISGGQRQRVALGRAIVRNPKVFLMDEPLSNLDAKLRTAMRTEITKLHKSLGTTFIYVTHDQVEAMTMADRIVVMKDGIVQQIDTPQDIYDSPNNMFVAGFIGAPQMNFIDVKLVEKDGEIYAQNDALSIKLNAGDCGALTSNGYIGKEVILGIRPEDIHIEDIFVDNSLDSTFEANVELGELMGAEIYAYLKAGNHSITARFDGRYKLNIGDKLKLAMDKHRIHIFDKETQVAIRDEKVKETSK